MSFVRKKITLVFECFHSLEVTYLSFDKHYLSEVEYVHQSLHYRPVNSASDNSVRFQEIPLQGLIGAGALQTVCVVAEILKIPWAEALETCFLRTVEYSQLYMPFQQRWQYPSSSSPLSDRTFNANRA